MSLGEHLEELRRRLIWALLGLVPILAVSMVFGERLLGFLVAPLQASLQAHGETGEIIATGLLETFNAYIKISLIAAMLVGSPWILYQLWRFVAPGLYSHERRFVYFLLPLSTVLTISGVVFLFKLILPLMLSFFIQFGAGIGAHEITTAPLPQGTTLPHVVVLDHDPPEPQVGDDWINKTEMLHRICIGIDGDGNRIIASERMQKGMGITLQNRVSEYIKLLLTLGMAFAIAFQTPVIVLLLGWAGILDRATLSKYRKHAILVCAILAALLTPGDPASMILMLIPLYALYELGGLLLKYFPASRVAAGRLQKKAKRAPEEEPDGEPVGTRESDEP
jgi:sec-independent protein translocase protein TatC